METTIAIFTSSAAKAVAGKDILLAVFSADGSSLLAISGQQGLTINRSADSIEVTSKDTQGGWKSKLAGSKESGLLTMTAFMYRTMKAILCFLRLLKTAILCA